MKFSPIFLPPRIFFPLRLVATVFICLLGIPTQAYVKLTYTSDPLEFVDANLNGLEHPTASQATPPYLQAVFESTSQMTATDGTLTLFLRHSRVELITPGNYEDPLNYSPQGPAFIIFDKAGAIVAWEFALLFSRPSSTHEYPGEQFRLLESSYGNSSCDCDKAHDRGDIYTSRPYGNHAYVGTVEVFWAGENDVSNWTLEQIHVPEPKPVLLLLMSCLMMQWARRKRASPLPA